VHARPAEFALRKTLIPSAGLRAKCIPSFYGPGRLSAGATGMQDRNSLTKMKDKTNKLDLYFSSIARMNVRNTNRASRLNLRLGNRLTRREELKKHNGT
jgi:hypothetical protein